MKYRWTDTDEMIDNDMLPHTKKNRGAKKQSNPAFHGWDDAALEGLPRTAKHPKQSLTSQKTNSGPSWLEAENEFDGPDGPEGIVGTPLEAFYYKGLITEMRTVVKSGKEAIVYCCTAHPSTGQSLLAAKVYLAREDRNFRDASIYQEGRRLRDRLARGLQRKSDTGRELESMLWIGNEFETLRRLHSAGAAVVRPLSQQGQALLLDYLGDESGPAPQLKDVVLTPDQAHESFTLLLKNIEQWLGLNVVHGDLSPYNILFWDDRPVVIDFPQAVDPRFNPHAKALLTRDLTNVCRYFERYGLSADPTRLANSLWSRFQRAEL